MNEATIIALRVFAELSKEERNQVQHLLGDAIFEFYRSREENLGKYQEEVGRSLERAQGRIALAKKLHSAGLGATIGELAIHCCGNCRAEYLHTESKFNPRCPVCGVID